MQLVQVVPFAPQYGIDSAGLCSPAVIPGMLPGRRTVAQVPGFPVIDIPALRLVENHSGIAPYRTGELLPQARGEHRPLASVGVAHDTDARGIDLGVARQHLPGVRCGAGQCRQGLQRRAVDRRIIKRIGLCAGSLRRPERQGDKAPFGQTERKIPIRFTTQTDRGLGFIKEGDEVTLESVKVKKSATTPPERYTDATLLSAMEHAGRFVDDKELKGNLTNGLGTPATRADMIEKLLQNRYIIRDGKYLVPTAKGREVVRLSPLVLRSPELTGVWEGRLEKISKGKEDKDTFIKDIKKMASDLVKEVEKSTLKFEPNFTDGKKCPYCGEMMMRAEDADGSIHNICQKLSCQYEEREVKVELNTGVSLKKVNSYGPDGKIKLVIKKSAAQLPKKVYETKIEVVRPSKKAHRAEKPNGVKITENRRDSSNAYSGGTMADFFLKSQKRKEEDRNKKRK